MLVYRFICHSCQLVYVGSTKKTLEQRIFEHFGSSFRTNRVLTKPLQSTIRDHCHTECKCLFSVENFDILYKGNYLDEIRIAESIFIKNLRPSLNMEASSFPLKLS